jgi:hypothetical protein
LASAAGLAIGVMEEANLREKLVRIEALLGGATTERAINRD